MRRDGRDRLLKALPFARFSRGARHLYQILVGPDESAMNRGSGPGLSGQGVPERKTVSGVSYAPDKMG